jgi:hypothetical protein
MVVVSSFSLDFLPKSCHILNCKQVVRLKDNQNIIKDYSAVIRIDYQLIDFRALVVTKFSYGKAKKKKVD